MKRCKVLLILLCSLLSLHAQWRSAEDAAAIASTFLRNQPEGAKRIPPHTVPQLAFTRQHADHSLFYVFNLGEEQGFMIVSGNELASTDILGYTTEGAFQIDRLPCGLAGMMDRYARELELLSQQQQVNSVTSVPQRRRAPGTSSISPLLMSRWGQSEPFNMYSPWGCPTGCVPTALAQICYYYQYPYQGSGSKSYTWNGTQRFADFGHTTYHWDQMLPIYRSGFYNDEEAEAVATLINHLGVCGEIEYSTSGSSGSLRTALRSLHKHLGYDDDMYYAQRVNYNDEEWEELIYNELAKFRPVIYEGSGGGGGHAFIIDGYADGLYHINWGWDGDDNGYYYLSSLIPPSYAKYGGFTEDQCAYLSVKPEDSQASSTHLEAYSGWRLSQTYIQRGGQMKVTGKIMNCSVLDKDVRLSVVAVDQANGSTISISDAQGQSYTGLPMSYYFEATITFSTDNLLPGHIYTIQPVYLSSGPNGNAYIPLPVPEATSSLSLEILNVDDNGDATNGETYPRRMVIEELTATWGGWCPRGIVATEYMKKRYPDNFIHIAIHARDEMDMYDSYPLGLSHVPEMLINRNRTGTVDTSIMEYALTKISGLTAGEMVKVDKAALVDGAIKVKTHTRFNHALSQSDYRLAYVILEDNVGPYYQTNDYCGGGSGYMDGWESLPNNVSMIYNDVARSVYPTMNGLKGYIPTAYEAGVNYEVTLSIPLPHSVQNPANLSVAVLLLNGLTGEIDNADRKSVSADGWNDLEPDAIEALHPSTPSEVYTLDGRRQYRKQPGVSIQRTVDGRVRKILTK